MSNLTKKAIKSSLLKLLSERPLSQVTVKDIAADCGINRNTFYYYFSDVPALIEEVFMEEADEFIRAFPGMNGVYDSLHSVVSAALEKKQVILHIYNSSRRELYEQYLWRVCDHIVESYLSTALHGRSIGGTDRSVIEKYLSAASFGVISRWLQSGMTEDILFAITRIFELSEGMLEEMLRRCEAK